MVTETTTTPVNSGGLRAIYASMSDELKHRRRDKEIRSLCSRWKKHKDKAAQEAIVASFLPLCIKISNRTAKDYHLGIDSKEELEDVAVTALIETIDRFDPEYDNLFYSYALKRMEGAALDYVKGEFDLRSTWQKYLFFNLSKLKRKFEEETPEIPRDELHEKIIKYTHDTQGIKTSSHHIVDTEKLISLVSSGQWSKSVDTVNLTYDLDNPIQTTELRPEQIMLNEEQESFENAFTVKASLKLGKTAWFVIEQLIMQDNPPTVKQLAKKLGVSAQHIEDLRNSAIEQLREEYGVFACDFNRKADNYDVILEHERPKAAVTYYTYETNILVSAVMHFEETGFWPKPTSGKAKWGPLEGRDWRLIDKDIKDGKLDTCEALSLPDLLRPYKELESLTVEDILEGAEVFTEKTLNIQDILEGAKLYYKQNQDKKNPWPSCRDFTKIVSGPLEGETWGTIDKLLRDGGRGLSGGSSLSKLLEENGLGPHITIEDIITAAKLYHKKTGSWPSSSDTKEIKTGPLKGKSWKGVAGAFYKGYYGLPTDITLSQLLKDNGCYDDNTIDPADIITAAKLHKKETGSWPSCKDNSIIQGGPLDGEKWCTIHKALRDGYRGLTANGKGLPLFLKENGCVDKKPTVADVICSAILYKNAHPEKKWPTNKVPGKISDGTILDGMSWSAVDKRKIGGLTLFQTIQQHKDQPEKSAEHLKVLDSLDKYHEMPLDACKALGVPRLPASNALPFQLHATNSQNVFCINTAEPLKFHPIEKAEKEETPLLLLPLLRKPSNM